jgi:hypothetical protein
MDTERNKYESFTQPAGFALRPKTWKLTFVVVCGVNVAVHSRTSPLMLEEVTNPDGKLPAAL